MNFLTVPENCLRFVVPLLLPITFALISSCSSSVPPELAPAEDAAHFADSMGRGYAIHSPGFVRGNEYERGHVTLRLDHGENYPGTSDTRDNFTITAEVPMGVNITGAVLAYEIVDKFGRRNSRTENCNVGGNLTCRYEGEPVEKAYLEVDYKIFAPGDHEFTVSVSSDDQAPDLDTGVRTIIFRYVASTRYLQTLLDSAEKDASVTLPSGTYMGTLHGGDRLLDVQGAENGGTVLLSDNPDMPLLTNIGNGSVFSNLEFRSSGAPIMQLSGNNITIRDSLIAPLQGVWHTMQQLFMNNSYRLLYSRIEGWGGENGDCRSLLYTGPHYSDPGSLVDRTADSAAIHDSAEYVGTDPYPSNKTPSSVYIQNTIFRDNECTNLLLEYSVKNFSVSKDTFVENTNPSLFILNNTFVNNRGRIHFPTNRNSDVQIRNNLFVAHQNQITLPASRFQTGDHRFILARNLIWDSNFESLVDPVDSRGSGVLVEAPDLNTDPLFVDLDGGDYSLATGSPAIDAGAPVDAYVWTDRKGGVSSVQPDPGKEPAPVDGLLDGNDIMDIGAFEYIP